MIQNGSGVVGLNKLGTGTITLAGASANTFTGLTTVSAGTLALGKTAGVNAIGSNVIVGDGSGTDTLKLINSNQIPDAGNVTFFTGGVLDLNGQSETINGLASNTAGDGTVTSGVAGAATLGVGSSNANSTFGGLIQDGSGTVALAKSGTGNFTVSGANTYTGGTTLNAGGLKVTNSAALGPAGAPLALNGGTFDLAIDTSINAYTTLVGNGTLVTIISDRATAGAGITHTLGNLSIRRVPHAGHHGR